MDHKEEITDKDNHYLHVILTVGPDEVSKSKIQDLIELNTIMTYGTNNFQTACIAYNCKSNQDLKDELSKILLFCERVDEQGSSVEIDSKDRSIRKAASAKNLHIKLEQVLEWFDDNSVDTEQSQEMKFEYKRKNRFIVFTVCVPSSLVS